MRKLLVLLALALPLLAAEDERAVKEKLIADIEKLIDICPLVEMQLRFMASRSDHDGETGAIIRRVMGRI
ncbi:MAG TPA: hypothetical protein VM733_18650, partial [Thermoanaerobaculia bacterium]|nr:hypothetical protein [Thermoanaerobaculia bacterium]